MTEWKTRLLHSAVRVPDGFESLATPVYRGSTVVFPDASSVREGRRPERDGWTYGLYGTPTTVELAGRVCEMEGGAGTVLVACGISASALVHLALLEAGDHVLLPQSVYGPSQRLARGMLPGLGIEAEFYDPMMGEEIGTLLRENTRLVWCESPGSITMEVQDIPAIARAAHARGVLVAVDNTWAAGVLFDALGHGADVTMQALTKYVAGHSDLLLGSVTAREEAVLERLLWARWQLGIGVSPDDCSMALRGLLTMAVRIEAHESGAMEVAEWLSERPEVERVLHPAFASCPGNEFWVRDFEGASGLFSFVFREGVGYDATRAFVDALQLFKQGYSWGGVESLALNYDLREVEGDRSAYGYRLVRLHIGLEDAGDLIADIEQALAALR
ncbi:MAG: cystathionine beta-lyase [Acidobacteriaceae bacterium]